MSTWGYVSGRVAREAVNASNYKSKIFTALSIVRFRGFVTVCRYLSSRIYLSGLHGEGLNLEKGPLHEYRRLGCKHIETRGLTLHRDSPIRLREPSNASPIRCLANFQAVVLCSKRNFGRNIATSWRCFCARIVSLIFVVSGQFEFLVNRCGGERIASSHRSAGKG